MPRIIRHPDVGAFLNHAEDWLKRSEARNNLLLGITRTLAAGGGNYEAPIFLATVEEQGRVAGCAFRTPPFGFGISEMPVAALPLLVEEFWQVYRSGPSVFGPAGLAAQFAALWCAKTGQQIRETVDERLFELHKVVAPTTIPNGSMRLARPADMELVLQWFTAFDNEARTYTAARKAAVADKVNNERIFLWDDKGTVSMAGIAGLTDHGARIAPVYTPPALRRRGYAGALVAALSDSILATHRTSCYLYTDLSNAVANSIYQKIGYLPVCDVSLIKFSS